MADRLIGGCRELFELDESGALDRILAQQPRIVLISSSASSTRPNGGIR